MDSLFQTICRTGIFMICAQAVIHFRPQETYEKYLKLLVSAMVLIQLFFPVSRILFHSDSEELTAKARAFMEGLEEEMSAAESRAYETDALLERMTLEEIRKRMEEAQAAQEETGIGPDGTDHTPTAAVDDVEGNTEGDSEGSTEGDKVQVERIQVEEIKVQGISESK